MVEKEKRNIKFEYLDIPQFFINEETKEIDENGLIQAIRSIRPQITIMVICYSQILDLKFLFEESGLFPEMRINRDLNILSRGQILTMNDAQEEFIHNFTLKENIEKDVIISGPVGSGKTIMGLEAINMKKSHYMKKYGLSTRECKNKFRVIIGICAKCKSKLPEQLLKERSDNTSMIEIGVFCHACIAKCQCPMHSSKEGSGGSGQNEIVYDPKGSTSYTPCEITLKEMFLSRDNFKSYKHTFVMLDEIWSRYF